MTEQTADPGAAVLPEAPKRRARQSGRVTLAEVARRAGVSLMSASNAFRCPEKLRSDTLQRVRTAAQELGYIPDVLAGTLASGQSPVVGVLLPTMRNSSFERYLCGLRRAARETGRRIILSFADSPESEAEAVETFIGLRVGGVVLIGGDHSAATLRMLRQTATPFVETWLLPAGAGKGVGYDAVAAMTAMTALHLEAGRRVLALIDHDGALAARFRLRRPAFEAGVAGCDGARGLIHPVQTTDSFTEGAAAMAGILAREPQVQAVICPTDTIAAGALFECQRRGLRVPQDIAISGWGNYEISAQTLPSLTTLAINAEAIGHAALLSLTPGAQADSPPQDTGFQILRRDSA
ncbi:LacI family DNA-binding transcriptional regulator [Falsigemmobacter faecalis]|nr:LacI family DNA-binding transcriptional regulator [Falsigemmobacter faecalis]